MTDDELEERKEQLWDMEEIRGGDTTLEDDVADTSDADDTADMPDTADSIGTAHTSDTAAAGDMADGSEGDVPADTADTADTADVGTASRGPGTADAKDTVDTQDMGHTADTADTADTAESEDITDAEDATVRQLCVAAEERGVTVDDMRNVNVYLFDRVHAELKELQAEVNYRAMKQRGEKVQMNKELFNAIYRVAARHEDEILAELELDP